MDAATMLGADLPGQVVGQGVAEPIDGFHSGWRSGQSAEKNTVTWPATPTAPPIPADRGLNDTRDGEVAPSPWAGRG